MKNIYALCLIHNIMFCEKCGTEIVDKDAKFCSSCGASISKSSKQEKTKNKSKGNKLSMYNPIKNKTVLILILIGIIIICTAFFINETYMKDLEPRQGFELVSTENGVSLYHNSKDDVYMEVKEANNPNTSYSRDDVLGEKANVTYWFKKYTITCYKHKDKVNSKQSASERYPNANPQAVIALATMEAYDSVTRVEVYHSYLKGMLRDDNLKAIDDGIVDLHGNKKG